MSFAIRAFAAIACFSLLCLGCGSSGSTSPNTEQTPPTVAARVVDSSGFFSRGGTDSIRAAVVAKLRDSTLFLELSARRADTIWQVQFQGPAKIRKNPVGGSDSSFFMKVLIGEGSAARTTTCYANTGSVDLTDWTPTDSVVGSVAKFSGWGIARLFSGGDWNLCNFLGFSIQNAVVVRAP